MTLLPPLSSPRHPSNFPGVIPALPRPQDTASKAAAAKPSQPAAQADRRHQNGPLRPSARVMPNDVPGQPPGSPRQYSSNGTGGIHRSNSASFSRRPSIAPRANGGGANTTDDEEDNRLSLRPPKPPLLRSQSEYASPNRNHDDTDHTDNEDFEWGARHGFEDHYQSEDIISQLANVSWIFCVSEHCS
ncbi:hypothetical protein CONLIGDRAFT_642869 [Coniochaeta ligniaria NRRL 30616]|uniref:Uncharacterized protein n=1 Tax=Coniochaeta ligniaria NRRL 30616 TaxID=1408157 RepID=A0A1J7JBY6_9PEZI|nr:hypothetical protein CONLIGDRAFT_642869 [Coniochaeta ligniaria NRRL 30616]